MPRENGSVTKYIACTVMLGSTRDRKSCKRYSGHNMPSERETFNRLFTHRAPMRPLNFLRELTVIGLVNYYKWDRAIAWEEAHGDETIPAEELKNIQFTDQDIHDYEVWVSATLQDYVDSMRPVRSFSYGVWQSVVGGFVYSVLVSALLVIGYVAFKTRDIDLIKLILGFIGQSQ